MLEKKAEIEKGSRKMINGAEVWTKHYFPVDSGIEGSAGVYMTVDGSWIYLNGKPVDKVEALGGLPEQHKKVAIAWFAKKYPGAGIEILPNEEPPESEVEHVPGLKDLLVSLMAQVQALQADVAGLKGVPTTKAEPEEMSEGVEGQPLPKNRGGRPKLDKTDTLKEMGLGG